MTHLAETLREVVHRARARRNLTPEERANLLASRTPAALFTASLGGHPTYR